MERLFSAQPCSHSRGIFTFLLIHDNLPFIFSEVCSSGSRQPANHLLRRLKHVIHDNRHQSSMQRFCIMICDNLLVIFSKVSIRIHDNPHHLSTQFEREILIYIILLGRICRALILESKCKSCFLFCVFLLDPAIWIL